MSASMNMVILIGNLGRDPEVRTTQGGKKVANLNLATSESWKDQSGQRQEDTEWHRVVVFGQAAEYAERFLRKGSTVQVTGKNKTRKWTDQQGVERYTTEIITTEVRGIANLQQSGQGQGNSQGQGQSQGGGYGQQPQGQPPQQPNGHQQSFHHQAPPGGPVNDPWANGGQGQQGGWEMPPPNGQPFGGQPS